jgi:hypothetical protein
MSNSSRMLSKRSRTRVLRASEMVVLAFSLSIAMDSSIERFFGVAGTGIPDTTTEAFSVSFTVLSASLSEAEDVESLLRVRRGRDTLPVEVFADAAFRGIAARWND